MKAWVIIFVGFLLNCLLGDQVVPFLRQNVDSESSSLDHHYHHRLRHIIRNELEMLKSSTETASNFKEFRIPMISNMSLIGILDHVDEKNTRYFMIKVSVVQLIDSALLRHLDAVIMTRLWFSIRRIAAMDSPGTVPALDFVLVERAPEIVVDSLRVIAEKNFPGSQEQCRERPLSAIRRMGTWGNDAILTVIYLNIHLQYVTYVFSTRKGSVHDDTSFNAAGECLDRVNKYECLFLPTTNCDLPKELAELSFRPVVDNYLYDQADPNGTMLNAHNAKDYNEGIFSNKRKFLVKSSGLTPTYDSYGIHSNFSYYFTGHAPQIVIGQTIRHRVNSVGPNVYGGIINIFGYAFRPNAEFRLKIQHYVDHFRASSQPHYLHNTSCVWLHARKDDRMLPPSEWDMLEWCRNYTSYNASTKVFDFIRGSFKVWKNDTEIRHVRHATFINYGCQFTLPYGAATLEHFINASLIISPHTKTLFFSTDDGAWLTKAIADYRTQPNNLIDKLQLHLHYFHPESTHRRVPSIDTAAQLFATMELGQQCDGFVGYVKGSAIAKLFFESMCYRRNSKYLSCPPLFELGTEGALSAS